MLAGETAATRRLTLASQVFALPSLIMILRPSVVSSAQTAAPSLSRNPS